LDDRPIGVFDSGVGGLTVVKQVLDNLPNEGIVYFGDTARGPYGPKSPRVVTQFAVENARFLLSKKVKIIVVACNTASAVALNPLRERFDLPVVGVVEAGARAAVARTRNGKVGVIGTIGTITSQAYRRAISALNPSLQIYAQACPLFVSLAEEGWTDGKAALLIAKEYLKPLRKQGIDTLLLGCTHYPLLRKTIQMAVGEKVVLADCGEEVVREIRSLLSERQLQANATTEPDREFFLSDVPHRFQETGERFLGRPLGNLRLKRTEPRLVRGLW